MAVKKKTTSLKALHEAQLYAQQQRDAAAIAFVVLAEAGTIDAVTASEQSLLFAEWAANVNYTVGQLRQYGGKLYSEDGSRVELGDQDPVAAFTLMTDLYTRYSLPASQTGWEPPNVPALWSITSDPAEEWPEWSQPLGAHDAYAAGAKVSHNGKHWTSDLDGNVWEPGVYGWTEASE